MTPKALTVQETKTESQKLAKMLRGGEIIALSGPLGSGKTTFAKHLAKALKVKGHVSSPTFVLMHRYSGKLKGKQLFIYHLDLYRLNNYSEVKALGLEELWGRPGTVTIIEWADKIARHLPKKTLKIKFKHLA